ncbi:CHAD domain-containing protein [Streptomyces carpaticus]|uniref:CHAD domain-containing protein n=1 Tax=Streptomyces carpaticus TaxID=285558 RepID=UPI00220E38C4|nr:CHAD domain-containing protein [Streptomyces carpaticus]
MRRPAGDPELPAGSAGERVLEYLGRQVRLITGLDAAVRRREPDSVHRMRVATRRLRGTLRSQRAVLDRRRTRAVADELRWPAGELGTDRDRAVLAERLAERVAELPGELRRGPLERRVAAYTAPPPSGGAAVRAGAGTGRGVRTGAVTWAGDSALFGKTRVHACRVGVPAPGGPASACPEAHPVRGR